MKNWTTIAIILLFGSFGTQSSTFDEGTTRNNEGKIQNDNIVTSQYPTHKGRDKPGSKITDINHSEQHIIFGNDKTSKEINQHFSKDAVNAQENQNTPKYLWEHLYSSEENDTTSEEYLRRPHTYRPKRSVPANLRRYLYSSEENDTTSEEYLRRPLTYRHKRSVPANLRRYLYSSEENDTTSEEYLRRTPLTYKRIVPDNHRRYLYDSDENDTTSEEYLRRPPTYRPKRSVPANLRRYLYSSEENDTTSEEYLRRTPLTYMRIVPDNHRRYLYDSDENDTTSEEYLHRKQYKRNVQQRQIPYSSEETYSSEEIQVAPSSSQTTTSRLYRRQAPYSSEEDSSEEIKVAPSFSQTTTSRLYRRQAPYSSEEDSSEEIKVAPSFSQTTTSRLYRRQAPYSSEENSSEEIRVAPSSSQTTTSRLYRRRVPYSSEERYSSEEFKVAPVFIQTRPQLKRVKTHFSSEEHISSEEYHVPAVFHTKRGRHEPSQPQPQPQPHVFRRATHNGNLNPKRERRQEINQDDSSLTDVNNEKKVKNGTLITPIFFNPNRRLGANETITQTSINDSSNEDVSFRLGSISDNGEVIDNKTYFNPNRTPQDIKLNEKLDNVKRDTDMVYDEVKDGKEGDSYEEFADYESVEGSTDTNSRYIKYEDAIAKKYGYDSMENEHHMTSNGSIESINEKQDLELTKRNEGETFPKVDQEADNEGKDDERQ
ncbi:hypothetical protein C0J52_03259 [Blattella germanica]|nr:hypothetical protein C0J52_03259 [Blattella germanica]